MTQYLSYKHLITRIVTTSIIFWGYAQLSYAFYTCGYAVTRFMDDIANKWKCGKDVHYLKYNLYIPAKDNAERPG